MINPDKQIEPVDGYIATGPEDPMSVDDFIRELEAKEKDLHITAETSVIEIAESFEEAELPDFIKEDLAERTAATAEPPRLPQKAAKTKLEAENKKLKDKVALLEEKCNEMIKDRQRHAKDFANYRSRVERERRESFQNHVANLATQMLPALDDLNRAVDFAMEMPREKNSEFEQFFDGVLLVNQQINEVLEEMGISPIPAVGERFDPRFHEAAAMEETDEFPPNTVCGEILKGYRLGDRVVRHSIVRVSKPASSVGDRSGLQNLLDPRESETDHLEPVAADESA